MLVNCAVVPLTVVNVELPVIFRLPDIVVLPKTSRRALAALIPFPIVTSPELVIIILTVVNVEPLGTVTNSILPGMEVDV